MNRHTPPVPVHITVLFPYYLFLVMKGLVKRELEVWQGRYLRKFANLLSLHSEGYYKHTRMSFSKFAYPYSYRNIKEKCRISNNGISNSGIVDTGCDLLSGSENIRLQSK